MLTLPDGSNLTLDEVLETVDAYSKNWPCVFDLYDSPDSGPHDDLRPIDLLSLNALNGWGNGQPMDAMTNAWLERDRISRAVAVVCITPLEQLTDAEAEAEVPKIAAAIEAIDDVKGFGPTTAAKLFHRLRPNLGPIWDRRMKKWYDPKEAWVPWVRRVYSQVREPQTLRCLLTARKHLRCPLSVLRVWDVVLWQRAPRLELV